MEEILPLKYHHTVQTWKVFKAALQSGSLFILKSTACTFVQGLSKNYKITLIMSKVLLNSILGNLVFSISQA